MSEQQARETERITAEAEPATTPDPAPDGPTATDQAAAQHDVPTPTGTDLTEPALAESAPGGSGPVEAAPATTAQLDQRRLDVIPEDRAAAEPEPEGPEGPEGTEAATAVAAGTAPEVVPQRAAEPAAPRPALPRPAPPRPGPPKGVPAQVPPRRPAVAPVAAAADPVAPLPSPVPTASEDPRRWGRVDDAGVVYLSTPDGERTVGSWQAGAPTEGLAHFARRFDDMLTEVELLFARLVGGGADPKHTLGSARTLRASVAEASVVGDVVGLAARIDDLIAHADRAMAEAKAARDAARAASIAQKEALAAEAETLAAEATQWKQAGDRFTAILDEWRTIRGIDRKTDEALWKRFSKAREAFNRRRGSHFADLDRQRSTAKTRKEELVAEAEALVDSDDWAGTAARYRDLMSEWKVSGRAQKDADDALWQRFRTAQDAFFAHRSGVFAERDAEFEANAKAKRALLDEAERINLNDPDAARAALRSVHDRWEEIGKVPRDDIRPLDARLRALEERVREAADRQWRRTDPEAEARVAQFRDRVEQFEAQAQKAEAAGDGRRAKQAREQAQQWREWLRTAEEAVQHR